jgi:uncharacterized protein (DUF2249 family)
MFYVGSCAGDNRLAVSDAIEPVSPRAVTERKIMDLVADASPANEVDLRGLRPEQGHARALQLATKLTVGASFILVNDGDPKRLRHQFEAEYRHQFFWNYLQEGPRVWRVHIGRLQAAA